MLSVTFRVADREPAPPEAAGVNVMLICWLWPVCRTRGRVGDPARDNANSVLFGPETLTLFSVRSP